MKYIFNFRIYNLETNENKIITHGPVDEKPALEVYHLLKIGRWSTELPLEAGYECWLEPV